MKKVNVITFNGMVRDKIMTKIMCEKAAASVLTFNHLKCAFARNGYDELPSRKKLLSELSITFLDCK